MKQVLCGRYSDEEFFQIRCKGSQSYYLNTSQKAKAGLYMPCSCSVQETKRYTFNIMEDSTLTRYGGTTSYLVVSI